MIISMLDLERTQQMKQAKNLFFILEIRESY